MRTPKTKHELEKAIAKLEKANKKWHDPERTSQINRYKKQLENMEG